VHVTASELQAPLRTGRGTRTPDVYGQALLSRRRASHLGRGQWRQRDAADRLRPVDRDLDRWLGACDAADRSVLDRCSEPALDVGCGPGRLVAALEQRGVGALGIDVSTVAVDHTRARGGEAVRADVFGPVPAEGRWAAVLLLDGNVGIGGSPARLLRRCGELIALGGQVLVELAPPGRASSPAVLRLESDEDVGPWFRWATLSVDDVDRAAAGAGLQVHETWSEGFRWFAALGG
jgi:SAM-dependent methyltransferase